MLPRSTAEALRQLPGFRRTSLLKYLAYGPLDAEGSASLRVVDSPSEEPVALRHWNRRLKESRAAKKADWILLWEAFPALQFPVGEKTVDDQEYLAAVRRGQLPSRPHHPNWSKPGAIAVDTVDTGAGRVLAIRAEARKDFEILYKCLGKRNRPVEIPATLGATYLTGLINWARLGEYKDDWIRKNPFRDWRTEWKRIVAERGCEFREALLLVTVGPYGSVAASEMSLSADEWQKASMRLRIVHEGIHHALRTARGFVSQTLSEELVADAIALREVLGKEAVAKLPRILGLERNARCGGVPRFVHYIPEELIPSTELIREIALEGAERLADQMPEPWDLRKAITTLDQWSLRSVIPEDFV